MTIRTIACSCSLSLRPLSRSRARSRPRFSAPACWCAAASSDMLGVLDTALGGQIDADRGSAADRAADVQGTPMQAGQLNGERKPQARAGMGNQGRFVDAAEPRLGGGDVLFGDAHTGIGDDEAQAAIIVD